jgi:HEAT repeat protein
VRERDALRRMGVLLVGVALLAGAGCGRGEQAETGAPAEAATSVEATPAPSLDDAPDLVAAIEALGASQTRDEVLEAIDQIRLETDPRGIPPLGPFIHHEDPEVALSAVETIEFLGIGTPDAVPVLREAVGWKLAPEVKIRVLEALYEQRTEAPGKVLIAAMLPALEDPDSTVRREAAEYLGMLGESRAVESLREQLARETDPQVRKSIEWSIAFLESDGADVPPPPREDAAVGQPDSPAQPESAIQ